MDIELRETSSTDSEFLYQLNRATMHDYVVQTWGQWDEGWQRQHFSEHFDPPTLQIVVADQKDIGVLNVIRRDTEILLRQIVISPEFQRKGIGTQLILSLSEEAGSKKIPLTLQVLKVNPARTLYERLGFVITGETVTHYLMAKTPQ